MIAMNGWTTLGTVGPPPPDNNIYICFAVKIYVFLSGNLIKGGDIVLKFLFKMMLSYRRKRIL